MICCYFYGPTRGILEQKILPAHRMTENRVRFIHFMSNGDLKKRLRRLIAKKTHVQRGGVGPLPGPPQPLVRHGGGRKWESCECCVTHSRPGSGAAPSRKERPALPWPRLAGPPSWLGAAVGAAAGRCGGCCPALPPSPVALPSLPFSFPPLHPSLAWPPAAGRWGVPAVEGPAPAGRGEWGLGRRGEPVRELREPSGLRVGLLGASCCSCSAG